MDSNILLSTQYVSGTGIYVFQCILPLDSGKDWGQEEEATEDEIVGWHHKLNGHEFEQTPGDSEGQGNLECCGPWGCKESDTTERLNNNNYNCSKYSILMR